MPRIVLAPDSAIPSWVKALAALDEEPMTRRRMRLEFDTCHAMARRLQDEGLAELRGGLFHITDAGQDLLQETLCAYLAFIQCDE